MQIKCLKLQPYNQFNIPWFHSWYNPIKRIIKNKIDNNDQFNKFENLNVKIIGRIKVISTSKIKNITVIRKKCKENGIRDEDLGSNPHSKGEDFSRSKFIFTEIINENNKIKFLNMKNNILIKIIK